MPRHAAWRPQPSTTARRLTRTAGLLSPFVRPDVLHQLYKRIPSTLRPSAVSRGGQPEPAVEAARRNRAVLAWFNAAATLIAPSDHLRGKAIANGLGEVEPRSTRTEWRVWFETSQPTDKREGFVSIGTVAWHKGTDRVVDAYRKVFPDESEPLKIHGPILDAEAALGHPVNPVLSPDGVRALLHESRALIMGSRWAENAPLILLEARAAGCPVIAPAVGGIPEPHRAGVDGLLSDPADDGDLAVQWRNFLSRPPMNPRPPQRFSVTVDALEQIYRRVTREHACA